MLHSSHGGPTGAESHLEKICSPIQACAASSVCACRRWKLQVERLILYTCAGCELQTLEETGTCRRRSCESNLNALKPGRVALPPRRAAITSQQQRSSIIHDSSCIIQVSAALILTRSLSTWITKHHLFISEVKYLYWHVLDFMVYIGMYHYLFCGMYWYVKLYWYVSLFIGMYYLYWFVFAYVNLHVFYIFVCLGMYCIYLSEFICVDMYLCVCYQMYFMYW